MGNDKKCLACNEIIHGRSDKKFCSDYCRNDFNNKKKSEDTKHINAINKILSNNRNILQRLCPTGKFAIKKEKLASERFDFNYFTNIYKTQKEDVYYFCYDYGYRFFTDNDKVLIVKKKEWI